MNRQFAPPVHRGVSQLMYVGESPDGLGALDHTSLVDLAALALGGAWAYGTFGGDKQLAEKVKIPALIAIGLKILT